MISDTAVERVRASAEVERLTAELENHFDDEGPQLIPILNRMDAGS